VILLGHLITPGFALSHGERCDRTHVLMSVGGACGIQARAAESLRFDHLQTTDLRRVQRRRQPPVRWAQALQRRQNNQLVGLAQRKPPIHLIKLISNIPSVKRLLGRIIGLGIRREHVRTHCC